MTILSHPTPDATTARGQGILTQAIVYGVGAKAATDQLGTFTLWHLLYAVANPVDLPKNAAPWVIFSTLLGTRAGDSHRAHGQFTAVVLDIDRSNPALEHLRDSLGCYLGGVAVIMYTSRSATADNRKWRVIIPTARTMTAAERVAITQWIADMLALEGIDVAPESLDMGRIWYLPNRGEFYQYGVFGKGYLNPDAPQFQAYKLPPEPQTARTVNTETPADFRYILPVLEAGGLVLGDIPGGHRVVCPWSAEHTGRDETGSAYFYPTEANNWLGGFKCHHGHGDQANIFQLMRWAIKQLENAKCKN